MHLLRRIALLFPIYFRTFQISNIFSLTPRSKMKKKTKEPVLCHVNSNFKCKQRLKALFTSNIRKRHLISSYDWSISGAVIGWYLPTMANIKKIISKTNVIFTCTCPARWISHSIFFFKFFIGLNKKNGFKFSFG